MRRRPYRFDVRSVVLVVRHIPNPPLTVTAIVLLNTERDKVNDVVNALTALDGGSEVHSVAGRVDLVAILRVLENDALADLVTNDIRQIKGITDTETLIGFRAHSQHDLEKMFTIGMD